MTCDSLDTVFHTDTKRKFMEIINKFSPPLFIQFSLTISQDREDIVCAPVKHLPTCLGEIFQVWKSITKKISFTSLKCVGFESKNQM